MKKLFALVLAVAMVMSLAAVAFAAVPAPTARVNAVGPVFFKYSSSNNQMTTGEPNPMVSYGTTFYYPLHDGRATSSVIAGLKIWDVGYLATAKDAIEGIKITKDWSVGGDLVKNVEIIKKKYDSATTAYAYFLAVTVVPGDSTSVVDIVGEVTLKKASGKNKICVDGVETANEIVVHVGTDVKYKSATPTDDVTDSYKTYKFDTFGEDTELSFSELSDALFTFNAAGQKKVNVKADVKFDADLAAAYPDANFDFFNGYGASFNKTGVLYLPSETAAFCYKVGADNALTVAAAYDENESGFMIKTRTLGKYVISDVELTNLTAAVKPVAPVTPEVVAPVNPNGGAAA